MEKDPIGFKTFFEKVKAAKQPLCMVIFGPPGSGKGTNARTLSKALGIAHIETGAMIRAEVSEGSSLGKKVQLYMKQGLLVPNKEIYQLVEKRLSRGDCKKGVIFDGMPRTLDQTRELERILTRNGLKLNLVVNLVVPDKVVIKRMTERARKESRPDDLREGVIETRLKVYHKESNPIFNYYNRKNLLVRVEGTKSIDKVYKKVRRKVRFAKLRSAAKAAWAVLNRRRVK